MADNHWRPMTAEDIAAVADISHRVHGEYGESADVYAERLRLFPAGCFIFGGEDVTMGFLVCHPWHSGKPPTLDALLGDIPKDTDCLYLHDLALLPEARGMGAGGKASQLATDVARDHGLTVVRLVAVHGAESFWRAQGFAILADEQARQAAATYGENVFLMQRDVGC